jgi:hypothetical protein
MLTSNNWQQGQEERDRDGLPEDKVLSNSREERLQSWHKREKGSTDVVKNTRVCGLLSFGPCFESYKQASQNGKRYGTLLIIHEQWKDPQPHCTALRRSQSSKSELVWSSAGREL